MKIKHLSFFAVAALAMGMASCSTEEPGGGNEIVDNGERLHAKIQLYLPTATRSTTVDYDDPTNSSDGYEIGQTYENNVKNVTVCLATYDETAKTYTPKAVSATSATPVSGFDASAPVYSINFRHDDIVSLHDQTVYIFAFCNADGKLNIDEDFNASDFVDKIMTIASAAENQGPWANGDFLMANAPNTKIRSLVLPTEDALKKNYNTPEKALDLGRVDVARVVSRFDFKQLNGNVYPVYDVNLKEEEKVPGNEMASVKVLSMAPINVAKEYYLLPRVSNDGTDTDWDLCGVESPLNWVVSPNWADKNKAFTAELLGKYHYQADKHAYSDEDYFKFTPLAALDSNDDDDDNNWGSSLEDNSGYKIWRYVTENTLPATAAQKKGISTGVLFKAQIVNPKPGSVLATAMASGRDIYSFNGVTYGDVAALRAVVGQLDASNPLYKAFVKVFGTQYLGQIENPDTKKMEYAVADANLKDCTSEANANTFKIYRATMEGGKAHYYVYYLYRNRHFDNNNPTVMKPMEFGTVRNNIYKLSISTISEFGHPADPNDDPDPEDPEDPDEDPKTYLKVACRVVPWMVRVNSIEF